MTVQLTARNAKAEDLVRILQDQQAHKNDVVVPSTCMKFVNGNLVVKDSEPVLGDDGVTLVNGTYRPTDVFDGKLAARLDIPVKYLQRLRADRPDLYDANANGLLHGRKRNVAVPGTAPGMPGSARTEVIYPADDRSHLVRLFSGDSGGEGVARSIMSDQYGLSFDNLDMLTAVMKGLQEAGVKFITRVSNLSERGVHVRFECPEIWTHAPELLQNYKSPFDNGGKVTRAGHFDALRQQYGAHHIFSEKDAPVCFIGMDFKNSETGDGKYYLTPVIEMVRCTNGWTIKKDGISRTHRGSKLDVGRVKLSADTIRKAGQLVVAETRDAVTQWLSKGYLDETVAELSGKATVAIEAPSTTVPAICKGLGFDQAEQQGVLDMFIMSGQPTAGGLANAVSAYAQTIEDVDRALEVESKTVDALEAAAR